MNGKKHRGLASSAVVCAGALGWVGIVGVSLGMAVELIRIDPADGAFGDEFGCAVAIDGDLVVVGSLYDEVGGTGSGSAYVFSVAAPIGDPMVTKLLALDRAEGDTFGSSVGISGNVAVVGANLDEDNGPCSGSAYLFDATSGAQLHKLVPASGAAMDEFGSAVAIDGGVVVVGAWKDDDSGEDSGSAFVFDTATGAELHTLHADDAQAGDYFGHAVAVSGGLAVVGAQGDDNSGGVDAGAAYVFDAATGAQLRKLVAGDGSAGDGFGFSVAIRGGQVVVGAWGDDDNGANAGSAYVFDAATGLQIAKLLPGDGSAGEYFGWSVAVSDGVAAVGAWFDDSAGAQSGSAYLFDVMTGVQTQKLLPAGVDAGDKFGWAVASSGARSVIGAPNDELGFWPAGAVYVFDLGAAPCELPADLNGDGVVDTADLGVLLGQFGGAGSADLNDDGVVDTADLGILLGAFGSNCP
ncbi:MAG: hypothetical protein H6813_03645 [Phycisphaeraceae bacterium]|nr:hypothetical protein [Phycisphaeraceae bacterium]MCB9847041.1 hypothetical protein [Phycisphaeraceae bacterium]